MQHSQICHCGEIQLCQVIAKLSSCRTKRKNSEQSDILGEMLKQQSFACDLARRLNPTSPTDGVGDAKLLKSLECSIKGRHLYGALEVKD